MQGRGGQTLARCISPEMNTYRGILPAHHTDRERERERGREGERERGREGERERGRGRERERERGRGREREREREGDREGERYIKTTIFKPASLQIA